MKSKTTIEKQLQKKRSTELIKTIIAAKKNDAWLSIAGILAGPRRKKTNINLEEIDKNKENETIVVPGKVLSQGNVTKKINVVALNFSEGAKEKLINSGCKFSSILEEIKKNPGAINIKILN